MRISELTPVHISMANDILNGKFVLYQETDTDFVPLLGAKFHYTEGAESFRITDDLGFSCEYGGSIDLFITESVMTLHTKDHSFSVIISSFHSLKRMAEKYIEKLKRRITGKILTAEVDLTGIEKKIPRKIIEGILEGLHSIDDFDVAVDSFDFSIGDFDISILVNFVNDSVLMKDPKADPGIEVILKIPKFKVRCKEKDLSSVLHELYGDLCVLTASMEVDEEEENASEADLEETEETEETAENESEDIEENPSEEGDSEDAEEVEDDDAEEDSEEESEEDEDEEQAEEKATEETEE